MKLVDTQIIKACKANNRQAQKQLYELLLPYLGAVVDRYLRDHSYKKDVLQEGFIKIFKTIDRYDPAKAPFKYWAVRIMVNTTLNYNKRIVGTPNEEITDIHHTISEQPKAIQNLSNEELISFLKNMPADYYTVFNLSVIDGYTHDEIAVLLSISTSLSRKRLSRARQWIKKNCRRKPNMEIDLDSIRFILN